MVEFDFHFYGGIVLFILLMLEVSDRVVMKRDLEIARDIQSWLLPATPPQVPGTGDRLCHPPGEHRRRRLLRRLCPPGTAFRRNRFLLAVADVAGKSIPGGPADGHLSGQPSRPFPPSPAHWQNWSRA